MNNDKLKKYTDLVVLIIGLIILFYLFFRYILIYTLPFFIGWFLAFVTRPPAAFLAKRLRMKQKVVRLMLVILLFAAFADFSYTLVYLGIACFGLSLIFHLVTLPVEFNASRRAMQAIENADILTDEEQKGARKTLSAAAMTYVAATAVSLAQLLRLLMIFGGRGRRRND